MIWKSSGLSDVVVHLKNGDNKMEWNKEKRDLKYYFTIPNIMSYLRILLIVPIMIFFFNGMYIPATICLAVSALTDCCDGFVARRFNQITQLGRMLDPVADKLTLIAVGVCICVVEKSLIPIFLILTIKDILMLIGGIYMLKNGVMPPASEWYGKLGTILFYSAVIEIVLFDIILGLKDLRYISVILLTLSVIVMIYSLVRYFLIFKQKMKEHKELSGNYDK